MIGMRSINMEVPALGDSLSWDTNLCVCDITTSSQSIIQNPHGWIGIQCLSLTAVGEWFSQFLSLHKAQKTGPHAADKAWLSASKQGASKPIYGNLCSDITNDQFGISEETTVFWGRNVPVYWVNSHHLLCGGSNNQSGMSHHIPPPPGGAGFSSHFVHFLSQSHKNHLYKAICLLRLNFLKSDWNAEMAHPPPPGRAHGSQNEVMWLKNPVMWPFETKMATNDQSLIDLEAYSALKQSISWFLLEERNRTGLPCDHPVVIQNCIWYFNWLPTQNQCLNMVIRQIAASARATTK